jgi:ferredoxin
MIISKQKPLDEIVAALAPYSRPAIIGCGGCAAVCQAGGTKQVEELAQALDEKEVVFTFQIDEPCDQRILARELRRISNRLVESDVLLILACGAGVQTIASAVDKPCLAGLDTLFPGAVIHSNEYRELCIACGECILNHTAAICPRTLCPKGIANGPCSEKLDEHCSVDTNAQCVWVSITKRIEGLGLSDLELNFCTSSQSSGIFPRSLSKAASNRI